MVKTGAESSQHSLMFVDVLAMVKDVMYPLRRGRAEDEVELF